MLQFLVRGQFRVFNRLGEEVRGVEDPLYLNKYFRVEHPRAVKEKAMEYVERLARKKYGQGARIELIGDLKMVKREQKTKPKKKRRGIKKEGVNIQLSLY